MASGKRSEDPLGEFTGRTPHLSGMFERAKEQTTQAPSLPHFPKGESVALLAIDGPLKGKSFPIDKTRISLGRSKADIVLEDSGVSGTHCVVEVHGTSGLVLDLESTNGTFVNGEKVETCELKHLSEFRIGKTTMMFAVTNRRV